jgi:hypothetical protein
MIFKPSFHVSIARILSFSPKENARRPQDFRPIALQNFTVKCISKVLTTRLQPHIPSLISPDQYGFVMGHCLADNFVYVADLLRCCYQWQCPTIVLKLDFHKAFDCVSWDNLNTILLFRGFLKPGVTGFRPFCARAKLPSS